MLKVKISSRYTGSGWYDPKAQMNFLDRDKVYLIPDDVSRMNINRYLTLGYLYEVNDEEAPKVETKEEVLTQDTTNITPNELLKDEIKEEVVVKEEPIKEPAKKIEKKEPTEAEIAEEFGKAICQYCGKEFDKRGILSHEKRCKAKPKK